jgi:type IV pilus assembly protein PilN
MIRINLLPFRAARKKENIRRQVSIFFLSLAFVFICLFYYNYVLGGKVNKLNVKIATTKTELDKYNKINKEIAEIKRKLENLRKKMEVIAKLQADRHAPSRLLDIMTQAIVAKRMWFTRMESRDRTVNIHGIALDNKTVADFMIRLENCGLFSEVALKTLKAAKVQNSNLKSFQITCTKKPPEIPNKAKPAS